MNGGYGLDSSDTGQTGDLQMAFVSFDGIEDGACQCSAVILVHPQVVAMAMQRAKSVSYTRTTGGCDTYGAHATRTTVVPWVHVVLFLCDLAVRLLERPATANV